MLIETIRASNPYYYLGPVPLKSFSLDPDSHIVIELSKRASREQSEVKKF